MHEALAEILINNLLFNAIKHNSKGETTRINISGNGFEICNTGKEEPLSGNEIFNRFVKKESHGLGLGLAIVQRICETHSLMISYEYLEGTHCFRIKHTD